MTRTYVVGVGMTKFEKPETRDWDYPDIGLEAGTAALVDAGIAYSDVEHVFAGYCLGESTSGQRVAYELGLTGVPIVNVNNNCSTGSTALYLARNWIKGGLADCVLALGFEKMSKGSLGVAFTDRAHPCERQIMHMVTRRGWTNAPGAAQQFGNLAKEYIERHDVSVETFAKIGEKNHRHSVNNPRAQFQKEYSLADVLGSTMIFDPLTKLQCSPTSDGGAAAIIVSERFVEQHGLWDRAVEIAGQAMATDVEETFAAGDIDLLGYHMATRAARQAYEESGYGPEDAQVIELHDCFSSAELVTYETLGLCAKGEAAALVHDGATTYGGQWVVNPSGGLIAKGHPLGATGLAQCAELTWQLRGAADGRQVDGATVAIQHNVGLGGAAVVTVYAKGNR